MREKKEKLPILDIEKVKERIIKLNKEAKTLHDRLIQLGMAYINFTISDTLLNEPIFKLRDSIIYRYNSIIFHLRLLIAIHNNNLKKINKDKSNGNTYMVMLSGRENEICIFDSIVFHTISLFDYLGNLLDYVCCTNKQMKLKWNGIIKSIRAQNSNINNYSVSKTILDYNNEFVDKLYGYRSDIIHFKRYLGSVTSSLNLETGEKDITVFAPPKFVRSIKKLKELSKTNKITLNYVGFWIAEESIKASQKIVEKLLIDVIQRNNKLKIRNVNS